MTDPSDRSVSPSAPDSKAASPKDRSVPSEAPVDPQARVLPPQQELVAAAMQLIEFDLGRGGWILERVAHPSGGLCLLATRSHLRVLVVPSPSVSPHNPADPEPKEIEQVLLSTPPGVAEVWIAKVQLTRRLKSLFLPWYHLVAKRSLESTAPIWDLTPRDLSGPLVGAVGIEPGPHTATPADRVPFHPSGASPG